MKLLIKKVRFNTNTSQSKLATQTGISIRHLSDIENNKRMPSIEIINKIALALGVSIDQLVDNTEK